MRKLTLLTLSLILTSCASMDTETSGATGCPVNEVKVLERNYSLGNQTWTAECRGKRFHCVHTAGFAQTFSCKEELAPANSTALQR